MAEVASTLRTFRVGGQLDPSWLTDSGQATNWTDMRVVATLEVPTDGVNSGDPGNAAQLIQAGCVQLIDDADTAGCWWSQPLKPTVAANPVNALQPAGLAWSISVQLLHTNQVWFEAATHQVLLDGDRDYFGEGETFANPDNEEVVNVGYIGIGTSAFAAAVEAVVDDLTGGPDLYTQSGTSLPDPATYFATGMATFTLIGGTGNKIGVYITDGTSWVLDQ